MVTTTDPELAERVRRLRSQGVTKPTWQPPRSGEPDYDSAEPGYNFRFDEPRAALGSALLPGLDGDLAARGSLLDRYREALEPRGVQMPFRERPGDETVSGHLAVCLLPV